MFKDHYNNFFIEYARYIVKLLPEDWGLVRVDRGVAAYGLTEQQRNTVADNWYRITNCNNCGIYTKDAAWTVDGMRWICSDVQMCNYRKKWKANGLQRAQANTRDRDNLL